MTRTAEPAQGNHRAGYREVPAEPRFRLLFTTRAVAITAGSPRITTFSVLVFATTGSPLLSAVAFGIGFFLVGPACFGSVAAGIGTGGAIALAGSAAVLTAGWIRTWNPATSPVLVPVPNYSTGSENDTEQHACGSPAR